MTDYQKFFLYNFLLIFLFILITILLSLYHINEKFVEISQDKNYLIFNYQKTKINNTRNIDTIFLGDSTLGNAINIELFDKITKLNSINLALNKSYGFAGQYNLLKRILLINKKKINKVYIINSLFFLDTDLEDEAFFVTSKNIFDFFESKNKIHFLLNYYKYFLKYIAILYNFDENEYKIFVNESISDDFIKQKKQQKLTIKINNLKNLDNKYYYFSKLVNLCKKNNIELFYLNGPIYKKFFLENQSKINNKIFYEKFTNITIIKDLVLLDKDKVGDFPTHVNKSFKDLITNEYIDILKLNELL